MHKRRRDWFWRPRLLDPREFVGIFIVAALATLAIVAMSVPYNSSLSYGFGPEWDCSRAGQGDPVCVKTKPSNSN